MDGCDGTQATSNGSPSPLHSTSRTLSGAIFLVAACAVLTVFVALPAARMWDRLRVSEGTFKLGPEQRDVVHAVRGEWELVRGRLIAPALLDQAPKELVEVPRTFFGEDRLTYRATITGLNPDRDYALYIMNTSGSGRVFVNGTLLGTMGPVGPGETLLPGFVPRLFPHVPRSSTVELVIQVANMTHARGGIWQDVYFGPSEEILRLRDRLRDVELFVGGAILLMALYHVILYWLHPTDRSTLFFAAFSVLVAVKTLLSGQQPILHHFQIQYQTPWIRGAFVAITLAVPVFLTYLRELFPRRVHGSVLRAAWWLAAVQTVLAVVLPFGILQIQFHAWQIVTVAAFIYSATATARAAREHRPGAASLVGGLVFLFAFTLNDILFDMHVVHSGYMLSAGLFGFLFSQAVVLAMRQKAMFSELHTLRHDLEHKVAARTAELEQLARQDSLTGLTNRRHGGEMLMVEVRRYLRYGTTMSLILIDLDHFKEINDTKGHQVGDDVLTGLSRILRDSTRVTDRVCRWGGEEFLIILPETNETQAHQLAEKLQETLALMPLETRQGDIFVTFSGGISGTDQLEAGNRSTKPAEEVMDELLRHADLALYAAKNHGRNRVVTSVEPTS